MGNYIKEQMEDDIRFLRNTRRGVIEGYFEGKKVLFDKSTYVYDLIMCYDAKYGVDFKHLGTPEERKQKFKEKYGVWEWY